MSGTVFKRLYNIKQRKRPQRIVFMKNTFLTRMFVLMMAFALILAGCIMDGSTGSTSPTNPPPAGTNPGTTPTPNPALLTLSPALRAVPTAASTSSPMVLDSYTDGTKNYYLIDVGYVRNMYVSKIFGGHYNGASPMTFSKTTINTNTVTNALTETISESVIFSDTKSNKKGIDVAVETEFPFAKFSAKLKLEWEGSKTNSNTSSKSTETSVSKTQSFAESLTVSTTVGENGEPEGYYRYSVYAVSDIYFIRLV